MNLVELEVPVPPMLAQALGYSGETRYLAIYWDAEIGEARWDDGARDEDAHYEAWAGFINHDALLPALENYDFGDPHPARHFLLLDRENIEFHGGGTLFVGRMEQLSDAMRPGGTPRTETATPAKAPTTQDGLQTLTARMEAWLNEQSDRRSE
jgi:hypothetical protein